MQMLFCVPSLLDLAVGTIIIPKRETIVTLLGFEGYRVSIVAAIYQMKLVLSQQ